MRAAGRIILGLALVMAIAAAGLYLLRGPAAGFVIRAALERAGVENPRLRVKAVSLRRLRLANVAAGDNPTAPDVSLERVEADFDWRALIRDRRVESIRIGPGSVKARIGENGAVEFAGLSFAGGEGGAGGRGEPPLGAVAINVLDLALESPRGNVTGSLSGALDMGDGGEFSIRLDTERYGDEALAIEDAAIELDLRLDSDGGLSAEGALTGDLAASGGAVRGFAATVKTRGASWRGVFGEAAGFRGEAIVDIRSAGLTTNESPALAGLSESKAGVIPGGPVSVLAVVGRVRATYEDGRLALYGADDAPLRITADNGGELALRPLDGGPLYAQENAQAKAAFGMRLTGAGVAATARFVAETSEDGVLHFDADAAVNDYQSAVAALGRTEFIASGTASAKTVEADVALQSTVLRAAVGDFDVSNAIVDAPFHVTADIAAKRVVLDVAADNCVRLDRARFVFSAQKARADLDDAQLCPAARPLVIFDMSGSPRARLAGVLTAAAMRYRLGQTVLEGAPPLIDFAAIYTSDASNLAGDEDPILLFDEADPLFGKRSEVRDARDRYANSETSYTVVKGRLNGGRIIVNDVLSLANMNGAFETALGGGGLAAESRLQSVRLSQTGAKKQVAPVVASGEATLNGDMAQFSFALSTLGGAPLGAGEGVHDMITSKGAAAFDSGLLVFSPKSLQPAQLISPLYGLVRDMTGAASATVRAEWGADAADFRSTAELRLDNVTFVGPSLAVSKTAGLSGTIRLSSLAPLTTDGVQTVHLDLVNLDALRLENGEIVFEMPGDETLRLHRGSFPWFGGEIGVYDATASLAGDKVTAPLRAADVDLSQLLASLNVNTLSGEGVVEGVLPLVFENGKARIENGELSAVGPGVIRYTGAATGAAAAKNEGSRIAFDVLRELHFDKLTAKINGPLDGDIDFRIVFEGINDITLEQGRVASPIIYRISIEAPLLALIDQARVSSDFRLQYERLKPEELRSQ